MTTPAVSHTERFIVVPPCRRVGVLPQSSAPPNPHKPQWREPNRRLPMSTSPPQGSFPNTGPGERLDARTSAGRVEAKVLAQRNLSQPSAPLASLLAAGNLVVEGSTVMNRRNRLRRAALVLAP